MRNCATLLTFVLTASAHGIASAEIHEHGGSANALPHEKYVRVVSEADSPVQQAYVKSKDGAYVAAAIRKPKGDGPFPAIILFHGAPGGRGMEQLVGWSRGDHGGPVWERFTGITTSCSAPRGRNDRTSPRARCSCRQHSMPSSSRSRS